MDNDSLNRYYFKRLVITLAVIMGMFVVAYIYRDTKLGMFNKTDYKAIRDTLTQSVSEFNSNEDMAEYITDWANSLNLKYTEDSAGNIIFSPKRTRADAKDNAVVCVSYNYKTAEKNAPLIAAAQYIAQSDIRTTKYNVIFFNNDKGDFGGYKNISKKYFPNNSKVIYLDYRDKSYASLKSFNETRASYAIKKNTSSSTCDSAVHLTIKGVQTDEVTSSISSQPNPITAFGTVLSQLESRASHYEISNLKVINEGNMFPSSLEVDILVNSYSLENLTEYLDKRSEAFVDKYEEDFPEIEYTYEVIEDDSKIPSRCYTEDVCKSINNIIYTFNNGTYRFDEDDDIPADYKEDDIYGINSIEQLRETDNMMYIDICTQALTDGYMKKIVSDNKTIASFSHSKYVENESCSAFSNNDESLYNQLNFTYIKVNDATLKNFIIKEKEDFYFTPCSYIQELNPKTDIIHLAVNEDSVNVITNTVLCYIDSLGRFLSL